ncbi:MAG: TIGR01244 family phosphatase [Sphingomonadales bacterium]|nr:TIGR01244 family phosphatase [Sphingomonadales bacterium]
MIKQVDAHFYASEQIGPGDVAEAARLGIGTIVNNRPDGEDPSAPQGNVIEAAAKAHGLAYAAIPVSHAGFSHPQVDAMAAVLARADGPVLGYCRSGTRSTLLWALAQAKAGAAPDEIAAKSAQAGYDVAPIRAMIDALAAGDD